MKLGSFRTFVRIDDPETGAIKSIAIKVKRFTVEEGTQFARDYYRSANPPSAVMLARKDTPDEQEIRITPAVVDGDGKITEKEKKEFVLSDEDIRKRRHAEMTDEQKAIYAKLDAEEEAFSNSFIIDTLRRYIRVVPGQDLETVDDFESDDVEPKTVHTGADLAAAFGGREDVTTSLIRVVHLENSQTEASKKVLRSVFGFVPFSAGHEKAADGQKPAQTAPAVNEPVSVVTVDADPNTTARSSGEPATD
jgi:hypothetical protein